MRVRTIHFVFAMSVFGALNAPISALANPELEACRSTGLIALRERDPSFKDVTLDFDGMTVAKANTKVEDGLRAPIVVRSRRASPPDNLTLSPVQRALPPGLSCRRSALPNRWLHASDAPREISALIRAAHALKPDWRD